MTAHIALQLAAVLVSSSPGPTPAASPSAEPSPISAPASPTPTPILAGITLGENAAGVMRRLGVHASGPASGDLEIAMWPAEVQDIVIVMVFDQNVRGVSVRGSSDPHAHCADPFGVRLGDALQRLLAVRGTPDATDSIGPEGELRLRYGPVKSVNWSFIIVGDKVAEITVSDGI